MALSEHFRSLTALTNEDHTHDTFGKVKGLAYPQRTYSANGSSYGVHQLGGSGVFENIITLHALSKRESYTKVVNVQKHSLVHLKAASAACITGTTRSPAAYHSGCT
jgi:hypothetical protein